MLVDQLEQRRASWLLVIFRILCPCPHLLTDLHVRINILGIQLISSTIVGWPVKEVVLTPGAVRILEPKLHTTIHQDNRAHTTSDIGSDFQPLSLLLFSVTIVSARLWYLHMIMSV